MVFSWLLKGGLLRLKISRVTIRGLNIYCGFKKKLNKIVLQETEAYLACSCAHIH